MPLAIDLYCGLGGWTEGLLAEGWDVIGFDIERHRYPKMIRPEGDEAQKCPVGGSPRNASGQSVFKERPCHLRDTMKNAVVVEGALAEYPAQLVLQDVRTLHGSQFRDADLIVASPPCQAYSYRAMPWKRAKALPPPDNTLFEACFRIQREACEAAGRNIPLIVENVRGAQKWVGRARWNYGSFYLWGDVPALMPMTKAKRDNPRDISGDGSDADEHRPEGLWSPVAGFKQSGISGTRDNGKGDRWFQDGAAQHGSKSNARKAASAMIAKIPLPLARYIGRVFYPLTTPVPAGVA